MFRKFLTITFLTLIFSTSMVHADKLRLNVGFWPGQMDSELENRFWKDDLLDGSIFGHYNLAWENKETYTIYPLGAEYLVNGIGPGVIMFGGNYIRYQPDYQFTGFGSSPSITQARLGNFRVQDTEFQLGYQLPVIEKSLFITPKIGGRWHTQEYNYTDSTFGFGTYIATTEGMFHSTAKGAFIGVGAQYYIIPNLSLLADYIVTGPIGGHVSGAMSDKRTSMGVQANTPYLRMDNASSGYTLDMSRWTLGAQYDITADLHVMAGVREERTVTKYPGYYNIPIVIQGTNPAVFSSIVELITDKIFWEGAEVSKKGMFFVGVSYDISL